MISGDQECKTRKSASMTVSVTLQAVSGKGAMPAQATLAHHVHSHAHAFTCSAFFPFPRPPIFKEKRNCPQSK